MNILFEEDGAFRAGSLLADNNTSLQVELPSGKRSKVKLANVLLRFATPAAGELLHRAELEADAIDIDFLWEVCGEGEFGFEDLAGEYYGAGHNTKPDALQAASVLMRLRSAPMYFHRKGKGRYRKAPPEILQAALAGLEKKRLAAEAVKRMADELAGGKLPAEFSPLLAQLLYAPDRNRNETKALEAACASSGKSPARLLFEAGAIASTHDYQLGRFLHEFFPEARGGTSFPAHDVSPAALAELPQATVAAFSIDDAATTEIDDAFSVTRLAEGWRIGIHIAAPGLGFTPDSALGRIARTRLSTVYMPGRKITMLPEAVVEHYTLAAGRDVPAISLYLEIADDYRLLGKSTRLERVPVVANLRHHDLEPVFNETTLANGLGEFPYRDELKLLWELAQVLEAGRGEFGKRASNNSTRKDYNFSVDWDRHCAAVGVDEAGIVSIGERARGSPLDTLVAELMIVANASWGAQLRDAGIPALYRVQTAGKVRMSTVAAAHEGLGVECYAWSSSPLRRYCDLLNQWQLIAHLQGAPAPFPPKSAELMAAMRDFDLTYTAYADFQRGMERYWCLRWLRQEARVSATARVLKDELVRLDDIPLVLRMPSLPALSVAPRGARVAVSIDSISLLEAEIRARFVEVLSDAPATLGDELDDELDDDEADALADVPAEDAADEMPAESASDAVLDGDEAGQVAE